MNNEALISVLCFFILLLLYHFEQINVRLVLKYQHFLMEVERTL